MQKNIALSAALTASILALTTAHAGENKAPDIDGVSNGTSLKYNQNCLDIAYKNAYGTASGKPTTSDDYKNYKCYINKKVVPCQSMSEDGQTKKAETDYQDYLDSVATSIIGEQYISFTDNVDSIPHYGYAQYTNYRGIQQFYGVPGKKGITSFQCWIGPGCEVGVDASIYKKFQDANPENIFVTVNGVDYALTDGNIKGNRSKYYWTGNLGNENVTDFQYHENAPTRIMFVDESLLDVLMKNNGGTVKFEINIRNQ